MIMTSEVEVMSGRDWNDYDRGEAEVMSERDWNDYDR